jgi:hypothetical protein
VHIDEELLPHAEAQIKWWCDNRNLRLNHAYHADGTTQCHELVILNPEQHMQLINEYYNIHNLLKTVKDTAVKKKEEEWKTFIETTVRGMLPGMGDAPAITYPEL